MFWPSIKRYKNKSKTLEHCGRDGVSILVNILMLISIKRACVNTGAKENVLGLVFAILMKDYITYPC